MGGLAPRRGRLLQAVARRARWIAVLSIPGLLAPLVVHPLAGSANALVWFADLVANWQWLLLLGLVAGVAGAAVLDRRWLLLLAAAPVPFLTAPAAAPGGASPSPGLAVASVNVQFRNEDARELAAWVSEESPDLVVLLEVSPPFAAGLANLLQGYPHRRVEPREDPFGIALLSRHPMPEVRIVMEGRAPRIDALVDWQGNRIAVTAVHPSPPLSPWLHDVRNQTLRAVAAQAAERRMPAIVAGDLNATPWSNAFSGLADAGLRRATGLAPTWPSDLRGLMGIPIDHVLVTKEWRVLSAGRGSHLPRADHLPVLVRLTLTP